MKLEPPFTLPGFNVLLMGPSGTGKTHSIGTLVDQGVEVFYLALESGMESLMGYWIDRKMEVPANLHWHKVAAPSASFDEMISQAKRVNLLNLKSLAESQDPDRTKYNQFVSLLEALNGFTDERTGEDFGPVDKWDQSKFLVIDGLTGMGVASMALVVGGKPVRSQSDWQVAQNMIEALVRMLCDNCPCHFILISHIERERDEALGGVKIMASSLGQKLAPKLPCMFSDVVLAERDGAKWNWSTATSMADTKIRNLPISSSIAPNFGLILEKWAARNSLE